MGNSDSMGKFIFTALYLSLYLEVTIIAHFFIQYGQNYSGIHVLMNGCETTLYESSRSTLQCTQSIVFSCLCSFSDNQVSSETKEDKTRRPQQCCTVYTDFCFCTVVDNKVYILQKVPIQMYMHGHTAHFCCSIKHIDHIVVCFQ